MRLEVGCSLQLTAPLPAPLIAMLRPRSGEAQWIVRESYELRPWVRATEYVDTFGNLCQRLVCPQGDWTLRTEAELEVADFIAVAPGAPLTAVEDLPPDVLQFLLPSRYCPSDKLYELAQKVTVDQKPGYDQVDAIRAWIREHIAYRYGVSNASTSAIDTLEAKAGVCRDYAHIGLSLCRALRIPARMVVGYLHGLEPMDLHAWFEAFINGRWYTFDATQPEPRGGRVSIAYGRDAADVALITELGPLETTQMKVWVRAV